MTLAPLELTTDLSRYDPGEKVHLHVQSSASGGRRLIIRAYDGARMIRIVTDSRWQDATTRTWKAPITDGKGYLLVASILDEHGTAIAEGSCGVDVSSDWQKFPRYGYLSMFSPSIESAAPTTIAELARFHLNGLQFYDWQWKHHRPLSPDPIWPDIANRSTSATTIKRFISEAHKRKIACMAYNLAYGAFDDYARDGVKREWGLFDDHDLKTQASIGLPNGWSTAKLHLFDPANQDWQNYIFGQEKVALRAYGFDGWHMDQLGDLGKKYDAKGRAIELKMTFQSFVNQAQRYLNLPVLFNSVGGYGLGELLGANTTVSYVECWPYAQHTIIDVQQIVERSWVAKKPPILAAYMNTELARAHEGKRPGQFNEPGILLTDAVIMSSGGDHLELGDELNLLDHEYFPNKNLLPSKPLLVKLRHYYDFMTAYETLLRGTLQPAQISINIEGVKTSEDAQPGTVWVFARRSGNQVILHLINLTSSKTSAWNDADGSQLQPRPLTNLKIHLPKFGRFAAYAATPDDGIGAPKPLAVSGDQAVVPSLKYWTMVVLKKI